MIKKYYLFFNIEYLVTLFLTLSANDSVFNILSRDIITQYPQINPFFPHNEYIDALTHCLINQEKNLNKKLNTWLNKKIAHIDYHIRDYEKYEKKNHITTYLKKNCTDFITTAIKLWKIDGAMNLLVAYEIHRFHAGFDYDFTNIKNLETFKLAYKKGYINNEQTKKEFERLFTETVRFFCSHYTFGSLIIDPRGIKVPIPFKADRENLQYKYENGNLTLQNSSNEYIFKHDNDSLKLISSKKIETQLTKTKWSGSGNIGTDLDAYMWCAKKTVYYGFKIYPASIGCYRKIILKYSDTMFYGFAKMQPYFIPFDCKSLYFFYGFLPETDKENEEFSLKKFFVLHEMIYYMNYTSWLKLKLLRLLPLSRINRIISKYPYLKHITDTFYLTVYHPIPKINVLVREFFHFLSFSFLLVTKGTYIKTNLCLFFLNCIVYFLSDTKTYTNLYVWCGLE